MKTDTSDRVHRKDYCSTKMSLFHLAHFLTSRHTLMKHLMENMEKNPTELFYNYKDRNNFWPSLLTSERIYES